MLKDVPAGHILLKKEFETDSTVVLVDSSDPAADIRSGTLDALVEFVPPKTAAAISDNFATLITYDESRDAGNRARNRASQKISRYRENYLEQLALNPGLSRVEAGFDKVAQLSSDRDTTAEIMELLDEFTPKRTAGCVYQCQAQRLQLRDRRVNGWGSLQIGGNPPWTAVSNETELRLQNRCAKEARQVLEKSLFGGNHCMD